MHYNLSVFVNICTTESACLPVCLVASLCACLPVCSIVSVYVCLIDSVCVSVCLSVCLSVRLSVHLSCGLLRFSKPAHQFWRALAKVPQGVWRARHFEQGWNRALNKMLWGAGATALMAAAGKGRLHELAMLLAAGAQPEVQSRGGTARQWALRFGHAEAAEMLQQHEQAAQQADAATGGAVALSHYQVSFSSL